MRKEGKNTFLWILCSIILITAIIIIATKSYLVINLLLGNDVIIKLTSDKDNLFLKHNQSETVEINVFAGMNPFCKVECASEFVDLGKSIVIDRGSFNFNITGSTSKEYVLSATKIGSGQELYRFNVKCGGIKTSLCHTSEELKEQSIIIALNYNLSDDEQKFKDDSKQEIISLIQRASYLKSEIESLDSAITSLNKVISTDFSGSSIKKDIQKINETAYNIKEKWENQTYDFIDDLKRSESSITELKKDIDNLNKSVYSNVSSYNRLIDSLSNKRQGLDDLKKINVTNDTVIEINKAIVAFNNAINSFNQKNSLH